MKLVKSYTFWVVFTGFMTALWGAVTSDHQSVVKLVILLAVPLFVYQICLFFQGKTMVYFGVVAYPGETFYRFSGLFIYSVLLISAYILLYQ